jgi:phospholipid transport system transporter-binding protein
MPKRADVLTLPTELTHAQATVCLAQLIAPLAEQPSPVQVDATPLQHFDSSALAVLLALRRACADVGKPMVVQGLPGGLRDLAMLYGVEELLQSA